MLSAKELMLALRKDGAADATERDAARMIRDVDADGNCEVDFDEFLEARDTPPPCDRET